VAIHGHDVTGVEDEYFADANGDLALPEDDVRAATEEGLVDGGLALGGPGALLAALGRARTGRMGDIVATIRASKTASFEIRWPGSCWCRRSGNRQDGRGVAPGGVPSLHTPRDARTTRRARRRTEPTLLELHRERPAIARRVRRDALAISGLVTNVEIRGRDAEPVDELKATCVWRDCSRAHCAHVSDPSKRTSRSRLVERSSC